VFTYHAASLYSRMKPAGRAGARGEYIGPSKRTDPGDIMGQAGRLVQLLSLCLKVLCLWSTMIRYKHEAGIERACTHMPP
jgi:hypothetical protein